MFTAQDNAAAAQCEGEMLQAAKVVPEKTRRLPEDRRQELEKRLPLAAS